MLNIKTQFGNTIIKLFRNLIPVRYMNWKSYKNRIDFLDDFHWQQSVRKQSIDNIGR